MHRYRKTDEETYSLGTELTLELLRRHADRVTGVFVHPRQQDNDIYRAIMDQCRAHGVKVIRDERIFNILSPKDNCYVLATFRKFNPVMDPAARHVVLVNPGNAGNMGTIMRTAVGFGIPDIAIITPGVDVNDPKVIRASMGAFFNARWGYFDTIDAYLKAVSDRPLYPFMLDGAVSLSSVVPPKCYSLVFGNEATGLPAEYQRLGQSVLIRHLRTIDSLNLDNAVSIALYHFTKSDFE